MLGSPFAAYLKLECSEVKLAVTYTLYCNWQWFFFFSKYENQQKGLLQYSIIPFCSYLCDVPHNMHLYINWCQRFFLPMGWDNYAQEIMAKASKINPDTFSWEPAQGNLIGEPQIANAVLEKYWKYLKQ